ncbi:MAG TPA: prolyl oligopeptidase family serine peptidase [Gemmatimonadaceae bacterium]|nr:prolyl oligopeptidase family serine peptidase [Gemmatimonadaceae bacterium]
MTHHSSRLRVARLGAAALAGACCATGVLAPALTAQQAPGAATAIQYPATRKGDQVDLYHGVRVADPYRWLEDTDAPETKAWVQAENAVTHAYLDAIPERAAIKARLTKLWNYPKYTAPTKRGGKYFYSENSGLQNQSVLYVSDKPTGPGRVLLDPNTLSTDGTVALSAVAISDNGKLLGYGTSASGSDWQEFHVREVASGRDLPDTIRWVKFSGMAWTKDNKGFFYSRYDEPKGGNALTDVNKNQKLYYHRLGKPQSSDQLVFESPEHPDWGFGARVTDDGQFAIINVSQGTDQRNRLYFIDLDNPRSPKVTAPVVKLLDAFDASYGFVDNVGTTFYLLTDKDAPRARVVAVDINAPRQEKWRTVVPEASDALESVAVIGDRIVASYLKDAHASIRFFSLGGVPQGELALPGLGAVGGIDGRRGDREFFYTFTSFLSPTSVYRYDLRKGTNALVRKPTLDFDASKYETKQVFYTSKDGTRVPMFITAKKGVALDGNNPTLLYAYGGFNISLQPSFSPATLVWLEMGGVYAQANLRGGGEYGKEWHDAGTLLHKQNVFDDFIAGAEYLIREKYTQPSKLAIQGGSNGGLLIGAVMTQRPELFGVALPAVGVMDMLRFHKFTIGWGWTSDYGSSDDSTQFTAIYKYSPLHNLKPGTRYPATLVTTADHDDRVVPGHSFKFAATLQADQVPGGPPVLIRIESKAGHGAGKPTSKRIEEVTDLWAFTLKNMGVTPVLPAVTTVP